MKNKNGNQVNLSGEPDVRGGGDKGTRGQGDKGKDRAIRLVEISRNA